MLRVHFKIVVKTKKKKDQKRHAKREDSPPTYDPSPFRIAAQISLS